MKKIIFLSIILIANIMSAQTFPYDSKWKEIEVAAANGNVKSLLPQVGEIFSQAQKDGNQPEIIRSLLYQSQILAQTQESADDNAFKIAINNFETQIPKFDGATKSVLQSLLANIYYQYLQNTFWQRNNITELDTPPDDIAEWSSKQLLQKSVELYDSSMKTEEIKNLLKQEKTENWKQILTSAEDINLYPTLYDVLMIRSYNFFQSEKFSLFDDNMREQIRTVFPKIIDDLIDFHKKDVDKSAFLNFNLINIENTTFENQTDKAEKIFALAEEYKTEPFAAYIYYRSAQIFSENKDKKRAFEICQSVTYDSQNKWSENAKSLMMQLQTPNIQATIDETSLPNSPVAVTISTTNVDKVWYRIFENLPNITSSGSLESQKKGKQLKTGSWDLKKFDDYQGHSTIVALDGLPQGNYCIEITNNQNFNTVDKETDNMLATICFAVHYWTVIPLNTIEFQLINRKTGQPIANQKLNLFLDNKENGQVTSDQHGIFSLNSNVKYIYNPDSKTYFPISISRYSNNENIETPINYVNIFTDRAIYRPGQTVYFKAILYSKLKNDAQIIKNQQITIELKDANYQKISDLTLTTNDYGSVFGEFVLPQNALTGAFSLTTDRGSKSFSVEEYKRPKFEVKMDTLKGEFVLEKEVKTSGIAVSYAGANISDAKVVYRVERREIFPYCRWWFPPQPTNNETITQGETQTDNNGKFEIPFTAKPKNEKKKGEYRTYIYTVFADVTDINGETHSAQQSVTVGDLPKYLTLSIPQKSLQKDFTQITVFSNNLNGSKENSKGKITVTQLIEPNRILLPNKMTSIYSNYYYYNDYGYGTQNLDYQIIPKAEFVKLFPYLPYSADETNPAKWQRGKVQTFDFDTQKSDSVNVKKFAKGFYQIEAYTIYGNDTIRTAQMIEILDDNKLVSTDNNFFSVQTNKSSYRVGEQVTVSFLSDWKDATAILHVESGKKWIEHKEIPVKNGKGTYTITATDDFIKDGLFFSAFLLKENGYQKIDNEIKILGKPMDLTISTKTFRDKLRPGERETWELTVSGADKDKITAEVLSTMYDASLDAFVPNSFYFNPLPYDLYSSLAGRINIDKNYQTNNAYLSPYSKSLKFSYPNIVDLQDFVYYGGGGYRLMKTRGNTVYESANVSEMSFADNLQDKVAGIQLSQTKLESTPPVLFDENELADESDIVEPTPQIRSNLQETAFFYPNLYTDQNGDVKFSFTSPEALTKWKLLVLAHTQDLKSGTAEFYTQTQKELMVVPNLPRFVRQGDEVVLSTKINNLSGKEISGNASLRRYDVLSNMYITDTTLEGTNSQFEKSFNIKPNENGEVSWKIFVPKGMQTFGYEITARTDDGEFSDGEKGVLPVLPNRMLVTETMPIFAKEGQTKTFNLPLTASGRDVASRENFNLSLEITTNPLWIAVMSLPYLREYPYECSEQIFSRLYGNVLSSYILNQNPKIKAVFDNWNAAGHNISSLEQNQELKNILLEETPWVRDAQSQTEQQKRIAVLFDLNNMSQEFSATLQKLIQRQNADGGFAWFDGGKSSPYITEHIVQGFGQLQKMLKNAYDGYFSQNLTNVIANAILYVDNQQVKEIKNAEENAKKSAGKVDGKNFIHYYYVRSFWKDKYPLPAEAVKYLDDINKNISSYFKTYDLQRKAMIATTLQRYNYANSAKTIINNIKETSVESDEMGMYWKDNQAGWLWYQSPVEAQAKAIEAFAEISPENLNVVEEMKIFLMKNRQTNAWNSTKATTDAVYALMNFGKDWTNAEQGVNVWVGNNEIVQRGESMSSTQNSETAAGYVKTSWNGADIKPEMGTVKVEKTSPGTMWGGMYWQYFEDLDKITSADSNVKMEKSLFLKKNTDSGVRLTPANTFSVGDMVTVRLVITIDRDMEYIHIKDMRAAGFEPINVFSGYKYQNGCAYYESTRDAATNFFFESIKKGVYIFEYDVRANNAGTFSNGITTLQNMYAPEMSCHSAGMGIIIGY